MAPKYPTHRVPLVSQKAHGTCKVNLHRKDCTIKQINGPAHPTAAERPLYKGLC